jgi:predicted ATPase with chaperone activity
MAVPLYHVGYHASRSMRRRMCRTSGEVKELSASSRTKDRALEYLNGERDIPPHRHDAGGWTARAEPDGLDLADVRGHAWTKRAVEIAAAGGHNLLRYATTVSWS